MQKTLEILKSEDGLVIKKLSYQKLILIYDVPIIIGSKVVEYKKVKIRYKHDTHILNTVDYYKMLGNNGDIYKSISHQYGIEVQKINTKYTINKLIKINDKECIFGSVIDNFYFDDVKWLRDYNINNILT